MALKESCMLSIFLPAGWNVSVMAGATSTILVYEVTVCIPDMEELPYESCTEKS